MAAGERSVNFSIVAKDAASRVLKNINKNLTGTRGIAATVGADLKKAALGIAGLATGIAFFTAKAIQGAAADEASTAKLLATLKARGLATEGVTAAIDAQIAAAQKLGFTDDDVRSSVELSTRFTKKYSIAQKIQTTAMNLARATGISLADATLAVGKAYAGTGGKALKNLGITKKGIKGQEALNAILSKTRGTAEAYADTAEGAFTTLSIQASELKESFGAAFLPAVTKLFKGLQPFLDRFGNYIKAATPDIQKFTDKLVTKFLAKLPGWIGAAEEKLPSLFRQFGDFVDSIKGIGKEADRVLGPGGAIRVAITGIAAAFGGLRGAIATNLLASGVDPIKAYFISTASAGILEGIIKGMTASLTTAAVTKFFALFKNVPMTVAPTAPGVPGVPVPVKPGVPPVVPAAGAAGFTLAAGLAAAAAIPTLIVVGIQQALVGNAKEEERRRNNWTEAQQTLFYQVLKDQSAGMNAFTVKQKYGESVFKWVNDTVQILNGVKPFEGNYTVDPMTQRYGTPEVNVYVGQKEFDATVKTTLGRLVPGGGRVLQ